MFVVDYLSIYGNFLVGTIPTELAMIGGAKNTSESGKNIDLTCGDILYFLTDD